MIDLYFDVVVLAAVVGIAAFILLLIFPALEHYRWTRRRRKRIGWYS